MALTDVGLTEREEKDKAGKRVRLLAAYLYYPRSLTAHEVGKVINCSDSSAYTYARDGRDLLRSSGLIPRGTDAHESKVHYQNADRYGCLFKLYCELLSNTLPAVLDLTDGERVHLEGLLVGELGLKNSMLQDKEWNEFAGSSIESEIGSFHDLEQKFREFIHQSNEDAERADANADAALPPVVQIITRVETQARGPISRFIGGLLRSAASGALRKAADMIEKH